LARIIAGESQSSAAQSFFMSCVAASMAADADSLSCGVMMLKEPAPEICTGR
jgi:hypothetical protein